MRILVLGESDYGGGVERVTNSLINEWLTQGIDVSYWVKSKKTGQSSIAEILSYKIKPYNIDVILCSKGNLLLYPLVWRFPLKKVFVVQHVPIILTSKNLITNIFRLSAFYCLYPLVKTVICVSDGIKQNIGQLAGKVVRTVLIYNAVEEVTGEREQAEDEQCRDILMVGRLEAQKNYDWIINFASKHREILFRGDRKLNVLGAGPERDRLKGEVLKNNLDENIIFHGNRSDVDLFMKKSKFLFLCSWYEGLPTVFVEAARVGLPIVSFDCNYGPREFIRSNQTGVLIYPPNAEREFISFLLNEDKILASVTPPNVDLFLPKTAADSYLAVMRPSS